jgi:hypothetical protein
MNVLLALLRGIYKATERRLTQWLASFFANYKAYKTFQLLGIGQTQWPTGPFAYRALHVCFNVALLSK